MPQIMPKVISYDKIEFDVFEDSPWTLQTTEEHI